MHISNTYSYNNTNKAVSYVETKKKNPKYTRNSYSSNTPRTMRLQKNR